MDISPSDVRLSGAVPLDRKPAPAPSDGTGQHVIDVSEATFEAEVIVRSMTVPVVVDFWAAWCGPCKQLSPILEKLAGEGGGRWVLAKVDVDANQQLAAMAGVQGIPAVKAVWQGQLIGEFTGTIPEEDARKWIAELINVTGGAQPAEAEAPDPTLAEAQQAILNGDLDGATAAFKKVLDSEPNHAGAASGLARVELVRRTADVDPATARQNAATNPGDVEAQCLVADLDMLGGHVDDALARLLDLVRTTSGDDRDRARTHLIGLFDVLGNGDPRVSKARTALASALY
jgi:putative thioredoxin